MVGKLGLLVQFTFLSLPLELRRELWTGYQRDKCYRRSEIRVMCMIQFTFFEWSDGLCLRPPCTLRWAYVIVIGSRLRIASPAHIATGSPCLESNRRDKKYTLAQDRLKYSRLQWASVGFI